MNLRGVAMTATVFSLLSIDSIAFGQDIHAAHAAEAPQASPITQPTRDDLPSGSDAAMARAVLERSPRHGEWVTVTTANDRIRTFVVYPERRDKAPVVIVISDVQGMRDWIRAVGDQFAREGFIAVVPDMLSGKGPNGGDSDAFAAGDAQKAMGDLALEEITRRLDAVHAYAVKLPASNGRSAAVGFCWGGEYSFAYAIAQPELDAAVVYYGAAPDPAGLVRLKAPVLGLYGEDDARVNMTIAPIAAEMKKLGKSFETHTFPGAGHGFVQQQGGREANVKALEQAWPMTLAFLRRHTQ